MSQLKSICLLLLVSFCASGCVTTYYKHAKTSYGLSAGADTGPRGDSAAVHRAVLQHLLSQPGCTLFQYYKTLVSWGDKWPNSSLMTKAAFRDALLDLNELDRIIRQQGPAKGVAKHERYARVAAAIIAPHAAKSLLEHGYARVRWGHKLDREPPGISIGVQMIYITVHPADNVVKLHESDLFSTFSALSPVAYDVSGVAGAWDPAAKLSREQVAQRTKLKGK